jgi:iron(III) transport system permease protein
MNEIHPARRASASLPSLSIIVGIAVLLVAFLVLYPLGRLLRDVFVADGDVSLRNVTETLANPALVPALRNTGQLILVGAPCALLVGAVLAWLNERTDARIGWSADTLPIVPLLVPPVATAIGWIFLLAPTAGFLNALYRAAFGAGTGGLGTGPLNIYSAAGLIWVIVVVTVPLAYLTIAAGLRNVDPALEEASRMSGRGPLATLFQVTLPSIRNSLAAAAVLVVINIVSIFSVPVLIGSQAGIDVLTVLIFRSLNAPGGPRFDQMIVLSIFMLVLVQVAILAEYRLARRGRYATLGGRGRARTRNELGRLRIPAQAAMLTYIAMATAVPLAALALVSLQGFWSPVIQWERLSLSNYAEVFAANSRLGRAFANSLVLGLASATVLMVLAAFISYQVASSRQVISRLVNALTGLPAGVPHLVTGVGFLIAFGSGRMSLQGTLVLLFLAYLVLALPQATRSAGAALSQIGRDLWEGSLMSGASQLRTFIRIVLPLMLPGLLAGWVIVFVYSFSEISASVFLSSPSANPVTGPVIVDVFLHSGTFPQLAALALSVTAVQIAIVLVAQWAGRRRLTYLGP